VGLQSVSQLRDAHGQDGAQTLLSCLSSQLLLRANDPETAEYASWHLGDAEVLRESISEGRDRTRTYHNQVERLVLASQIQGLPNRVGFLRLAGQYSVRCVQIPLIRRATRMEAFVPRKLNTEVPVLPAATSVRRAILDADAILGRAQATGNEK
jgi:type IV secretory pathway TraG/TraD family ATPase VirD4